MVATRLARTVSAIVLGGLASWALNQFSALSAIWPGRAVGLTVALVFGSWPGALTAALGAATIPGVDAPLVTVFALEAGALGALCRLGYPTAARAAVAGIAATSVLLLPAAYDVPALSHESAPLVLQTLLALMVAPVSADLVASVAIAFWPDLSAPREPNQTLRQLLGHAFVLLATLPLLCVSTISGQVFAGLQLSEGAGRLDGAASTLADKLNSHIDAHLAGISTLAAAVDYDWSAQRVPSDLLSRTLGIYPAFRAVALADRSGLVTGIVPTSFSRQGLRVSDRVFFDDILRTRRTAVSDVVPSAANGDPIVLIGAPILRGSAVVGVAHASLDLEALEHFVASYVDLPDSYVTVLDRRNRVIYASTPLGFVNGRDLTESTLVQAADAVPLNQPYQYDPRMHTGLNGTQLAVRTMVATTGWTVIVQQPLASLTAHVPAHYALVLGVMAAALVGAVVAAAIFARVVTAPLETLVQAVRNLSPADPGTRLTVPPNAPSEVTALIGDVNAMQERLVTSYGALTQLTLQLEHRVAERTVELSEATAVLQNVVAALPGALLAADSDGRIQMCNESAMQLLERPRDSIIGLPMDDAIQGCDANAGGDGSTTTRVRAERTVVTATGTHVPVLVSTTTLPPEARKGGIATICVAIDIRDRKQLELELRQAHKLESVGRLAAGIAHEINTPVQFVSDSVHFLKEASTDLFLALATYQRLRTAASNGVPSAVLRTIDEDVERADLGYLEANVPQAIDRALDGLGRVATIVRSMKQLRYSDERDKTAVDLNEAVHSTLIVAQNEYKYVADVEMRLGELPRVSCFVGDVHQALLNIIVNAAHAIAAVPAQDGHRGRITVETRLAGAYAEIRISDTGAGIPEEIRDRVFDPFFTTKDVGQGTGQGLAIARAAVVDKHGGEFYFDSVVGVGTTFVVRLPLEDRRVGEVAA